MIRPLNFKEDENYYLFFDVETSPTCFLLDSHNIESSTIISPLEYHALKAENARLKTCKNQIGYYQTTKMISLFDEQNNGLCFIVEDDLLKSELTEIKNNDFECDLFYGDNDIEIIDMFWKTIERYAYDKGNLRIFAHNIGFDSKQIDLFTRLNDFEGQRLKNKIDKRGRLKSEKIALACLDKPFFINCRYDNETNIRFDDSYSFFSGTLKNLGNDLGIPKKEFKFVEGEPLVIDDDCIIYGAYDSFIIKEAICRFKNLLKDKELGKLGYTIAGTAMDVWRTSFLDSIIDNSYNKGRDKEEISKIERSCYFGGRNECREIGLFKNVYYFDVNSLYPYVMEKYKFPIKFCSREIDLKGFDFDYINKLLKNDMCYYIFKAVIKTDKPHIPIRDKRLLFVKGTYECYLHMGEFMYFWDRGEITKVTEILFYRAEYIFKNYIGFFSKMKIESEENPTNRLLAKNLQTNLYGKLGELNRETSYFDNSDNPIVERIIEVDENGRELSKKDFYGYFGMESFQTEENAKTAFPVISGAVTSYARRELLDMIEIVGEKNTLYCDTDSLISKIDIPENMKHDTEFGKWKNEATKLYKKSGLPVKSTIDIIIKGCKNYVVIDIESDKILSIKSKGVKKDAVEIDDDMYQSNRWWTVKTSKVKKESLFTLNHTVIMTEIKKNTLEYLKGKTVFLGTKKITVEGITMKYHKKKVNCFDAEELNNLDKDTISEFIELNA